MTSSQLSSKGPGAAGSVKAPWKSSQAFNLERLLGGRATSPRYADEVNRMFSIAMAVFAVMTGVVVLRVRGSSPLSAAGLALQLTIAIGIVIALRLRREHTMLTVQAGLALLFVGFLLRLPSDLRVLVDDAQPLMRGLLGTAILMLVVPSVFPPVRAQRLNVAIWLSTAAVAGATYVVLVLTDPTRVPESFYLARIVMGGALLCAFAHLTTHLAKEQALLIADNHTLEGLALSDPLTGLLNRRAFDDVLAREIARAKRTGAPLSVAVLDVDHFKRINDEHGHAQGDAILREIAAVMSQSVRATDWVARWGGEEFSIVMPGARSEGAVIVAERLCSAIRERVQSPSGAVTASVGAATWQGDDAASVMRAADRALYAAKRAGRDRATLD